MIGFTIACRIEGGGLHLGQHLGSVGWVGGRGGIKVR